MYYDILVASRYYHGDSYLTYKSSSKLKVGQIVDITLRNKIVRGVVINESKKPKFKTSDISKIYDLFIPSSCIDLIKWLRCYYPGPSGVISELFLPSGKIDYPEETKINQSNFTKPPSLTSEQSEVIKLIQQHPSGSIILHGDTGTGKTRIYIEQSQKAINKGNSVIILVPEIGLTRHLAVQLSGSVNGAEVITVHSGLTAKQKRQAWLKIANSKSPLIIVGARSALFSPVKNLGLIVIDEFHDQSYKQDQQPYYQTTRAAAQLAKIHNCQLILGSATPPVSDYWTFKEKGLPVIKMRKQAIKSISKVSIETVDLSESANFGRSKLVCDQLVAAIEAALKNREQSLLFLNRRGSARLILCNDCGWQAICSSCDSSLVYHADKHKMLCHGCGIVSPTPKVCRDCNSADLMYMVPGTKSIELEIKKLFPHTNVRRFDRDNATDEKIDKVFDEIHSGKVDIIIGTQSIAKGFDLPKLAVVGIMQADSGLNIADYTATEITYQLISQVSGRLGRGHRDGKIIMQTFHPDNELFKLAQSKNYEEFYSKEISQRMEFGFPPFNFMMKLQSKKASTDAARLSLERIQSALSKIKGIRTLGPSPSYPERIGSKYRWQLVVICKNRNALLKIINQLPSGISYNIDPNGII